MPSAVGDQHELAERIERVVADPSLDATARIRELRKLDGDVRFNLRAQPGGSADEANALTLRGRIATYIGHAQAKQEAGAMSRVFERALVREDADIRDDLLAQGVPAEELDAAGLVSHEDLDAATRNGEVEEAFFGKIGAAVAAAAAKFKEGLHPRERTGRWKDKPGEPLKLQSREGGAVQSAKPQHSTPRAPMSPGTLDAAQQMKVGDIAQRLALVKQHGLEDWPEKGELAQKILGDAGDTRELHTVALPASPGTTGDVPRRGYTPERAPVHHKIVGEFLGHALEDVLGENHPITQKLYRGERLGDGEKQQVREAAAAKRGGAQPTALFLAGGPASGKTSALTASPGLEPEGSVLINPDEIKERLPEYKQMIEGGEKYGANAVHEESSDLGKRLQTEAMDLGLNVVVDGTGDSKPGKFVGKMKDMNDAGYGVDALYVTVPTEEAVVRATARAMKTGRWVPTPELRAQHKNVSANFEGVAGASFVRDLKLFDTSAGSPELIASAGNGELKVLSPEAYQAFIAKKDEAAGG